MASITGISEWHRGGVPGAEAGPGAPWAVVIPGMGYTAVHPLLFWASTALVQDGWRVLTVQWDTTGIELPQDLDAGAALVEDAWSAARTHIPGGRAPDLLVGKSLGTLAAGSALAAGADVVALTPLLAQGHAPTLPAGSGRSAGAGGRGDGGHALGRGRRAGAGRRRGRGARWRPLPAAARPLA
ncbi:hypothetical protein [Actinomyces provencensis]|uniref:hypothetical protein n=1 Tax=Actinomyces provencensis TaxID=1720198 RepID=UPI0011789D75|nr:hypothetical protein [Actinomyces provencensis]